ncbi:MAG: alanine/ornithine racemase family PLP-dependent enzyme [Bacteroidales bacterium]|nr:alanine/ornithine racemase family PLP-dependent enzyme [Bacteroidales bacterium]
MAFIEFNTTKLKHNFDYLENLFESNNIKWAIVSKLLCGEKSYLEEIINLGVKKICDSRVTNLKVIKSIDKNIETIYIKPPAKRSIKSIVRFADISFNTEYYTIKLLSEEAQRQKKTHKIMIIIETGELREGVLAEDFLDFYEKVFELPNIEVVGIGTNLSCLYGVLPNRDKLIQLSLYEQLVEAKFNKNIPFVSGGSSVTIPLILNNTLPRGINHFRVGETLFLGTNVYDNSRYRNMKNDVFKLFAEVIEVSEKPMVPDGEMGTNVEGEEYSFDESDIGKTSCRAIIDLGLLDVDEEHITPRDKNIKFAGASSDMIVIDLGKNSKKYKVGDLIEFKLDYVGTLRLMSSRYIDKKIVS